MRVHIEPTFRGPYKGRPDEGGIRRIVDAQLRWLPEHGIEIAMGLTDADLVATHAAVSPDVPINIPWVVHTHGLHWAEYEWPEWGPAVNKRVIEAMRRADHITAPSEWVAYALRRGMWLRPTVLYHGIEPEQWVGGRNDGYVLWNKTRVDAICDPSFMNELAKLAPDVQFISTFGTGTKNVKLVGAMPWEAMRGLTMNAGVYLCTSRETMGIGTLEAMAAGVPILGWRWGGQAEIIRHRETGWLATPGDYDGLLEGLRWCIENREAVGRVARVDAITNYSWQKVMGSYAALYRGLVGDFEQRATAPKVSVIICCYNLASYLPQAVRSIQEQTMADWEIVVVDDASQDDTSAVAADLAKADDRIRVIRNKNNLYLAGALNAGIAASKGRYIIPLDADNMLAPNTLQVLSEALDVNRGIHISYGACKFVLDDGIAPDPAVSADGISRWPGEFSFRNQILHRNQIPSTAMYRREVWERIGGYRRRCRTAEDAEFWTRASSYGFVPKKVTGGVTLIYRQREGSMSRLEADWNWTAWLPWSRHIGLVPFGAAIEPPRAVGASWPVPSCEPPKIAVVIAVGPGHEDIVVDAIDSVEAQTFRQWEVVVVNDTGKPLVVPHPWAKVIDTKGKTGPAKARNIGIQATRAPLFIPLDADDYLQPDAMDELLRRWEEAGGVVYSQWFDDLGDGQNRIYDPPEWDPSLLISKGCIHAITALYPRSDWEAAGRFDPSIPNWEDWDLQISLASLGVCSSKVDKPLFTYRKAAGFRREDNQATFDRGKEAMLKKWPQYWNGEEDIMAGCRGCGGRRPTIPPAPTPTVQASGRPPGNGVVLLEFIGSSPGPTTFRGKATGRKYRFANDHSHKRGYVYAADAESLLLLRGMFQKVADPSTQTVLDQPVLDVQGPPARDVITEGNGKEPLSIKQLKAAIPTMSPADMTVAMAEELAGPNRVTAVKMLKAAQEVV